MNYNNQIAAPDEKLVFAEPEILETAYVQPTDVTRIAQALDYMPNDVTSVDEFFTLFNKAMKEEA